MRSQKWYNVNRWRRTVRIERQDKDVEACELSASVEAEWMRDQEKCPKILISRRRGGLFKHQNNSFFDLERHHLVCGAMVAIAPFFLGPQPLLLIRGGESPASAFPIARNSQDEAFAMPRHESH
jgi:hypothetical protein